jgi:hypothetical protein
MLQKGSIDSGRAKLILLDLMDEQIHVILKLMTEDQLLVSLEGRCAHPNANRVKVGIWQRFHGGIASVRVRSGLIQ